MVRILRLPLVWSDAHRPPVLVGLTVMLAALGVARWRSPATVSDPPGDGPRAAELAVRLDPNTADAGALSALPGLGPNRARAIVAYREAVAGRLAGRPAFATAEDLRSVKGIGTATVENLRPFLTFPTAAP